MKKLTLLSAVALICCAVSPTFAQVQIIRSGMPTPAPQLVSDQPNLVEPLPIESEPTAETIPDPFSYFDQVLPQPESEGSTIQSAEPGLLTEAPATNQTGQEIDQPVSLPVGRRHHGPSIADTIVTQDMIGNIPHAASAPVFWGGAPQTPNPVAQWLLRQECVDGLWANYPQQRAAECAHMWEHIAGHHGCGCAGGQCGTTGGACSLCSSPAAAPRNRYLAAVPTQCDSSVHTLPAQRYSAAACDGCQSGGVPADDCMRCAQQSTDAVPAQEVPAPIKTSKAKLPTMGWFR